MVGGITESMNPKQNPFFPETCILGSCQPQLADCAHRSLLICLVNKVLLRHIYVHSLTHWGHGSLQQQSRAVVIETVWSTQPKIFPIWSFVESLPTCGLEMQSVASGMKMEMIKGTQIHGLRGQSYQRKKGRTRDLREGALTGDGIQARQARQPYLLACSGSSRRFSGMMGVSKGLGGSR